MIARRMAILAVSFAFVSSAFAQNVQQGAKATGSAKEADTGQTTTLNTPDQPSTAQTGVQPRGSKVAPSTNSAQEKQ